MLQLVPHVYYAIAQQVKALVINRLAKFCAVYIIADTCAQCCQ